MSFNEKVGYKKKKETSGIGGQIYEVELAMLLLLEGVENDRIINFYLASNMEDAADFDDAVLKYCYENDRGVEQSKIIFLQAKHKETIEKEEKKIVLDTFLSQSPKGEFILRKYFSSYYKIKNLLSQSKNHPVFSNLDNCELIIYTNAVFNTERCSEHVMKKIVESNHVLNIQGQSNHNYYIELNPTEKIIKALQSSLDFEILVQELSKVVSLKTLDMNKSIFNDYHYYLRENVVERINETEGRFRKQFLENNNEFIKAMLKEIQTKKGVELKKIKSIGDLKDCLSKLTLELPEKFGKGEEDDFVVPFPGEKFNEEDIKLFLSKLKLFVSQPNERQLGEILQDKIRTIYQLEPFDNAVFSDVKEKIQKWWREESYYLTKENKFFQESAKVCFWFDVRPPTELFTGRETDLEDLHNKINRSQETITVVSQTTSVSGLGGIGKTELARRYIEKFANNFQNNIIWINAESLLTISEGFIRLAKEKLKINTKSVDGKEKSLDSIIDSVYNFFSKRKCLFVFDNAVNCKDFTQFLPLKSLKPSDQKPYILITSRQREWGKGIEVVDLFVLKLEDAINFVKKGLNIEHNNYDEEIEELVEKLHCFPLAIRQAIAYIENGSATGHYNISDYLLDYEKKTKELLGSDVFHSIPNDYEKTTFTTWKITINKIDKDQNGQLALEILSLMAYIASENINRNMFFHLSQNKNEVISSVRLLVKYSMINGELKQSILSIHRLVQEVIRIELNEQNQQTKFIQKTFDLFNHIIPLNLKHTIINEKTPLLSHLDVFLSHIENWIPEETKQQPRFMFLTYIFNWFENRKPTDTKEKYLVKIFEWLVSGYVDYDPRRCLIILEKMLEFAKKRNKSDNRYKASVLLNLGYLHGYLGNHQKEKEILEEALALYEKLFGPDNEEVVKPLIGLSEAYGSLGKPIRQKELLERALKINENILGSDHTKTDDILEKLAASYESLGDLQKAKEYLERCLKCKEKHYGVDNFNTVETLKQLASVSKKLGFPVKQKQLLEKIIKINEEHCGKNHPEVARSLENLGTVYGEIQEYEKQVECLEQALNIREIYFGNDNYSIADTLEMLGNSYGILMNFDKQKELLERSLKIKEKTIGPDSLQVALTLEGLGILYGFLEDTTKQIQVLERILQIKEKHYDQENFRLIGILLKLGNAFEKIQDYQKQKKLTERALTIAENHYGSDNMNVIEILKALANAYGNLQDYYAEKEILEKILVIQEKYFSSNDFRMAKTLSSLAIIYGKLNEYLTMKEYLERALIIVETSQNFNNLQVSYALYEIGDIYGDLGDIQKQKVLLEEAYAKAPEEPVEYKRLLKETIEDLDA